jgi:hypothetical protein
MPLYVPNVAEERWDGVTIVLSGKGICMEGWT